MSEEVKAIKRLEEMTKNYSLHSEDLHYAIVLYHLIINLQKENQKLKEKNEFLIKRENKLQQIEMMFKNRSVDLEELSNLILEGSNE